MDRSFTPAFLVGFFLLLIVVVINQTTAGRMRAYTQRVETSRELILAYTELSNDLKSAQIYTPTYAGTEAPEFYRLYRQDMDSVPADMRRLRALVQADTLHRARVERVLEMIDEQLETLARKNIAEIIQSGESWRLNYLFGVHRELAAGIERENNELAVHKAELDRIIQATEILTVGLSMLGIFITLFVFVRNTRLRRERQQLEGFLEGIMNTSRNGIVTYRAVREHGEIADFCIEYANPAVEDLLRVSLADGVGKTLGEITDSYVRATSLFGLYKDVVETGEQKQFETLYTRGDYQSWLYVILARYGDDGLIATFHDINALKQYEGELKEKISELEISNRELEQYAYVASHDLQEPLRKIQLYCGFLERTQRANLDEKGLHHLERIIRASERMSDLITDILNFSSVKREVSFQPVDLDDILAHVLDDLAHVIEEKGAQIEKTADLPAVPGIALQLNQLFYNLVNNALKFARPGVPPIVTVAARALTPAEAAAIPGLEANRAYWQISVRDNGIGFDAAYAEQIFGLFKRLNDRQSFPGSGIGLALCRKVVQNHGGTIRAVGHENEGAEFVVVLPG